MAHGPLDSNKVDRVELGSRLGWTLFLILVLVERVYQGFLALFYFAYDLRAAAALAAS